MIRHRATLWAAALALTALTLSGCSNSPAKRADPPTTTTSVPTPALITRTVTINGHTYPVPSEDGVHSIDPYEATGGQIVLTNKGFLPYHLIVQLSQKITWTNLSSHPERITLLHLPHESHLVPVGGTFTYSSPTLINFVYQSSSRYRGAVSIGEFVGS